MKPKKTANGTIAEIRDAIALKMKAKGISSKIERVLT